MNKEKRLPFQGGLLVFRNHVNAVKGQKYLRRNIEQPYQESRNVMQHSGGNGAYSYRKIAQEEQPVTFPLHIDILSANNKNTQALPECRSFIYKPVCILPASSRDRG